MEHQDIIAKIRKLLAMAAPGSGASEAEVETALRQAQKLMQKWGIDHTEDIKKEKAKIIDVRPEYRPGKVYSSFPIWLTGLAVSVAKLWDCDVIYIKRSADYGGGSCFQFVGLEADLEAARYTFHHLSSSIYREANGSQSFCRGAGSRVWARISKILDERHREAQSDGTIGTALVLVDSKKAAIQELLGREVSYGQKQVKVSSWDDYTRGQAFGEKLHLGQGLASTQGKLR